MAIENIGEFLYRETKFKYADHNIDKLFTIDILVIKWQILSTSITISHTYIVKIKMPKGSNNHAWNQNDIKASPTKIVITSSKYQMQSFLTVAATLCFFLPLMSNLKMSRRVGVLVF